MSLLRQSLFLVLAFSGLALAGYIDIASSWFPYVWIATALVYAVPVAALGMAIAHLLVAIVFLSRAGIPLWPALLNPYAQADPPLSAILLSAWYAPVLLVFSRLNIDDLLHARRARIWLGRLHLWPIMAKLGSTVVWKDRLIGRYRAILFSLKVRGYEPGPLSPILLAHRWLPLLVSSLIVEATEQNTQQELRPLSLSDWQPDVAHFESSSSVLLELTWAVIAAIAVWGMSA